MRRDMDLIRALILKLEELPLEPGSIVLIDRTDIQDELGLEDYSEDQVLYHYQLILEKGWVEGGQYASNAEYITFRSITSAGHDFADSVRDPAIWAATKEGALKAGGYSLDLLAKLAKGYIQKKIEQHTGI